jgi:hypothetical protein
MADGWDKNPGFLKVFTLPTQAEGNTQTWGILGRGLGFLKTMETLVAQVFNLCLDGLEARPTGYRCGR